MKPDKTSLRNNGYALNLDASLRYTRPATGVDYFPYPPMVGAISGFLRQVDMFIWYNAFKKKPWGPFSNTQPLNNGWQTIVPGLHKQA